MKEFDCLFADVTLVSPEREAPLEHAWVGVRDGKIVRITQEKPGGDAGRIITGSRLVLIPGLINAHSHMAMTALRGYADDVPLESWLFDHIFPAEDHLTREGVGVSSAVGMLESLACGVTGFCDMYRYSDVVCDEAVRLGMRACVSNAAARFAPGPMPADDRTLTEFAAIREKYPDHPLVRTVCGIHAVYTSNTETRQQMLELALRYDLPILVHLSETEKENRDCMEKYGRTPTQQLAREGIFDAQVIAAHCVWLSPEDRAYLGEKRVICVHNPVSNCKLASGIADVSALLDAGVPVALGIDGVASNNSHDLFEEMKLMALLGKIVNRDASAVTAKQAFAAATMTGAAAMGRGQCAGQIREGFDADLALLSFDSPRLQPCHDVTSSLVYAADGRDVVMTMCAGRVVYEKGEWPGIDHEKCMADMRAFAAQAFGRGR